MPLGTRDHLDVFILQTVFAIFTVMHSFCKLNTDAICLACVLARVMRLEHTSLSPLMAYIPHGARADDASSCLAAEAVPFLEGELHWRHGSEQVSRLRRGDAVS